jgi:hypothetical protein
MGTVIPGSWDGDRIAQLVSNLASNGLQYGAAGAPVTVSLSRGPDESLEVCVHNAGAALPPDAREHLFEPYWRGQGAEISHPPAWAWGFTSSGRSPGRTAVTWTSVRARERAPPSPVRLPNRAAPPGEAAGAGKATVEVPVA